MNLLPLVIAPTSAAAVPLGVPIEGELVQTGDVFENLLTAALALVTPAVTVAPTPTNDTTTPSAPTAEWALPASTTTASQADSTVNASAVVPTQPAQIAPLLPFNAVMNLPDSSAPSSAPVTPVTFAPLTREDQATPVTLPTIPTRQSAPLPELEAGRPIAFRPHLTTAPIEPPPTSPILRFVLRMVDEVSATPAESFTAPTVSTFDVPPVLPASNRRRESEVLIVSAAPQVGPGVAELSEIKATPEVAKTESVTVVDQLAEVIDVQAQVALKEGSAEFHMRLDPPELGTIHIHLTADAEGLTARLIVANDATRILIEGQLVELRQRLETAFASFARQQWNHGQGRGQQQQNGGQQTWITIDADVKPGRHVRFASAINRIDVTV